jgi:hypothetical protein
MQYFECLSNEKLEFRSMHLASTTNYNASFFLYLCILSLSWNELKDHNFCL